MKKVARAIGTVLGGLLWILVFFGGATLLGGYILFNPSHFDVSWITPSLMIFAVAGVASETLRKKRVRLVGRSAFFSKPAVAGTLQLLEFAAVTAIVLFFCGIGTAHGDQPPVFTGEMAVRAVAFVGMSYAVMFAMGRAEKLLPGHNGADASAKPKSIFDEAVQQNVVAMRKHIANAHSLSEAVGKRMSQAQSKPSAATLPKGFSVMLDQMLAEQRKSRDAELRAACFYMQQLDAQLNVNPHAASLSSEIRTDTESALKELRAELAVVAADATAWAEICNRVAKGDANDKK